MPKSVSAVTKATYFTIAGFSVVLSSLLFAADEGDPKAVIEQRQDNFEEIGASFKTVRDELRGSKNMDAVHEAAVTINGHAKNIETWFPAGTGPEAGIETEAKAEIWQQRAEFNKAAQNLVAESGKFMELTATKDAAKVAGGIRGLGGACKNCHDQFRIEKD